MGLAKAVSGFPALQVGANKNTKCPIVLGLPMIALQNNSVINGFQTVHTKYLQYEERGLRDGERRDGENI